MTVKFKQIKYKHLIEAAALGMDIGGGTPMKLGDSMSAAILEFTSSMVKEWDYIDEDTGDVIPLGQYLELTIEQFNELVAEFNVSMQGVKDGVKKTKIATNGSKSSYSQTGSKRGKRAASHPTHPNG